MSAIRPWGRLPGQLQRTVPFRSLPDGVAADASWLGAGLGRSYGDVGLNRRGALVAMRALDRFVDFDAITGLLRCEAGVSIADILTFVSQPPHPEGGHWLPAVAPGTRYVTVGGAIANDVHGKNHHVHGTFGCHVRAIELFRSDHGRIRCSLEEHPDLFRATIGGLGLTGIILSAELQLRRVPSLQVEFEEHVIANLAEYAQLERESVDWEYTAAWVDCTAPATAIGRGLFSRIRHLPHDRRPHVRSDWRSPRLTLPVSFPSWTINGLTLRAFNALYRRRTRINPAAADGVARYEQALFPLDQLGHWNRAYGERGFFQYQCVIPDPGALAAIQTLLGRIAAAGSGSMLVVLKRFGDRASPGRLSFPCPGLTLAIDLPNRGDRTRRMIASLDDIVREAGGWLYPAKDACMTPDLLPGGPDAAEALRAQRDSRCDSDLARRLGLLHSPAALTEAEGQTR